MTAPYRTIWLTDSQANDRSLLNNWEWSRKERFDSSGLNNVDAMCCNPNIRLFKARLETGFHLTHMFPVLGVVFHINSHADQLVMVERALIDPTTSDDDRVGTGRPELANQLVIGFQKVANRITVGLIIAALIVGAAMLMRVETSFRIWGYPGLAILLFSSEFAGTNLKPGFTIFDPPEAAI